MGRVERDALEIGALAHLYGPVDRNRFDRRIRAHRDAQPQELRFPFEQPPVRTVAGVRDSAEARRFFRRQPLAAEVGEPLRARNRRGQRENEEDDRGVSHGSASIVPTAWRSAST